MDVSIPAVHVRVFARTLKCFEAIGDQVTIEATYDMVKLSCFNAGQSAFATTTLNRGFFESYHLNDPEDTVICRVTLKCLTQSLRSFLTVENLQFKVSRDLTSVTMGLNCKRGVKKTFHFNAEEDREPLRATVDDQPYCVSLNPRVLSEYVGEFNAVMDDVTLVPKPESFVVRCNQSSTTSNKSNGIEKQGLQTELTIDPSEFDIYNIAGDDTELSFPLKEFKALLNFCDFASQNVQIQYERGGSPIQFTTTTNQGLLEADFILATAGIENEFNGSAATGSEMMPPPKKAHISESPAVSERMSQPMSQPAPNRTSAPRSGLNSGQSRQPRRQVPDMEERHPQSHMPQCTPQGSQVSGGFSSQHRSQAESSQAVSAALSAQYTGPSEETNHDDANQEEAPKDADDDDESSEDEFVDASPKANSPQSRRSQRSSYEHYAQLSQRSKQGGTS